MISKNLEDLLYNYSYLLRRVLQLSDMIVSDFESDSGVMDSPQYPVEHTEHVKEYIKYKKALEEIALTIKKETQVHSIKLAEEHAEFLSSEHGCKYRVFNKQDNGVMMLCVGRNESTEYEIIDVDLEITPQSTRGLFDNAKIVNGKEYKIKSFLPKEYDGIYEFKKQPQPENGQPNL